MNYAKRTLYYFICHTGVGVIILLCAVISKHPNLYNEGVITGIVGGFVITGLAGIILSLRLMKNPQAAEKVEIAKTEERSQLIRSKTNTAVHTAMLYAKCAGTLIAALLGYKVICLTLAAVLIVQLILYIAFITHYSRVY